jgi:hypothetical protein
MAHPRERYPSTFRRQHRTQVLTQIYLPLVFATLLLFIIPTIGLILTPNPLGVGGGQWAAIALMWLLAPFFVIIVLGLVVTVALIILLNRLTNNLPIWTQKVRTWLDRMGILVLDWCNRLAQPIIRVSAVYAVIRRAIILLSHPSEIMRLKSGE